MRMGTDMGDDYTSWLASQRRKAGDEGVMNQSEQPTRKYPGRDKVIFDPFAQEVAVGGPTEFVQGERHVYEVHRPCGHCGGTGRGKKLTRLTVHGITKPNDSVASNENLSCSQCLLSRHERGHHATDKGVVVVWGAVYQAFAYELTDAELNHLPPEKKLGAMFELNQHTENQRTARILCDQEAAAKKWQVDFVVRHMA